MKESENGPIMYAGKIWEERMLGDIEKIKEEKENHIRRMNRLLNEGEGIDE